MKQKSALATRTSPYDLEAVARAAKILSKLGDNIFRPSSLWTKDNAVTREWAKVYHEQT